MNLFAIAVIVSVAVIDQLSKKFAYYYLQFVCNKGYAFGFAVEFFNTLVPTLVLFFVLFLLFCEKEKVKIIAFSLILGGGLSNLFNRLFGGCVVDFIDLGIWPAFNIADASISLGVIVLVFLSIRTLKFR